MSELSQLFRFIWVCPVTKLPSKTPHDLRATSVDNVKIFQTLDQQFVSGMIFNCIYLHINLFNTNFCPLHISSSKGSIRRPEMIINTRTTINTNNIDTPLYEVYNTHHTVEGKERSRHKSLLCNRRL